MISFDVISLAISIGLSILSVGLGIFAIWFSMRLNDRSLSTLESIRKLANDIRSMTEVGLTHQKDFSSKMLDSLLEQGQYGRPTKQTTDEGSNHLEELIRERLETAEVKIAETVEDKIRGLILAEKTDPKQTEDAIDTIRREISRLSTTAQEVSSEALLPIAIRDRLRGYLDYPAHYILLAAIMRSGAKSLSDLETIQEQYHLPEGYDGGVRNLIDDRLLEGDLGAFSTTEDTQDALANWVDNNWPLLSRMIAYYAGKTEPGIRDSELSMAQGLEF